MKEKKLIISGPDTKNGAANVISELPKQHNYSGDSRLVLLADLTPAFTLTDEEAAKIDENIQSKENGGERIHTIFPVESMREKKEVKKLRRIM